MISITETQYKIYSSVTKMSIVHVDLVHYTFSLTF